MSADDDLPSAPLELDIAITARCNLRCRYCYYADEMAAAQDLPTERWLAFFDELGRLAVQRLYLTGGEPLARPDLFELIDGIVANRMRYALLTNGTLLTEGLLAQFEHGKRRVRLDYIQVSIDGSRAEIHDANRPASFERALRGLRLLVAGGFPAQARVTITRTNVDDLEAIARLLLEDVGLPAFGCNEAFPCGQTERLGQPILLTTAQRRQAMRTLTELDRRYPGRIVANAGPLALARQFQRIEEALARGETGMPGRGTLSGCGCIWAKLAVQPDGALVPCHILGAPVLGMAGVDDLQEVWRHAPGLQALRTRYGVALETLETCRGCRYQGFCTGGCPAGALFLTGSVDARNPMDCYRVHRGEDPYFRLAD